MKTMMPRRWVGRLCCAALSLSLGYAPSIAAQNADLGAGTKVRTCNIKGTVRLTIAGITTNTPLTCVNATTQASEGVDDKELANTTTLGVPLVANVAAVEAPYGVSHWANAPSLTTLSGMAGAAGMQVAQDGIQSNDVAGRMDCSSTQGSAQVSCTVGMAIGSLNIGGQPVAIPPDPVPINTSLPVVGLDLEVNVLGMPLIHVPLSGAVVLNQVKTRIVPGSRSVIVEHSPVSVALSGQVQLSGLGLLEIHISVDDYNEDEIASVGGNNELPPPAPVVSLISGADLQKWLGGQ